MVCLVKQDLLQHWVFSIPPLVCPWGHLDKVEVEVGLSLQLLDICSTYREVYFLSRYLRGGGYHWFGPSLYKHVYHPRCGGDWWRKWWWYHRVVSSLHWEDLLTAGRYYQGSTHSGPAGRWTAILWWVWCWEDVSPVCSFTALWNMDDLCYSEEQ